MKGLPKANTDNSLLLRTDFSDDGAWEALCAAVREPSEEGFVAYIDCLSDPVYSGLTVEQLQVLKPNEAGHYYMFIADAECLANTERPILAVDLCTEPGRTFRVIPSHVAGVGVNLSISNMDFEDFVDEVDLDGVFRGFSD